MNKVQNERQFQNFIKDTIRAEGGWVSQLHPGIGSDTGIPDLLTAVDSVGILPAELKVGSFEDSRTVWSRAIRPAQIRWHSEITSHGYLSCVLIGVWSGDHWRIFVADGMSANKAKDGFIIGEDATELDPRYLLDELDSWASTTSLTFED